MKINIFKQILLLCLYENFIPYQKYENINDMNYKLFKQKSTFKLILYTKSKLLVI